MRKIYGAYTHEHMLMVRINMTLFLSIVKKRLKKISKLKYKNKTEKKKKKKYLNVDDRCQRRRSFPKTH